jgi:hypothetical protein
MLFGPGYRRRYSDLLWAGRFGDRIPVGTRFSAPVQTGPGTNPASCTVGTGSFLRVKRPGRDVNHPSSSAEVKERVEVYLYFPSGPSWPLPGRNFSFTSQEEYEWSKWHVRLASAYRDMKKEATEKT